MRQILLLCAVVVMVSTTRAENDPKDLSRIRRQESSSSRPTCSCPRPRKGRDGLPGTAGATGPSGQDGERGLPGPAGKRGTRGPAGERGLPGSAGKTGAQSPAGEMGLPGPAGKRGTRGPAGERGLLGPAGTTGTRGPAGERGLPGSAGTTGTRGPAGERGLPGSAGTTGTRGPAGGGVVYTRWGRTTCPHTAGLVYDGLAAGSYYNHTGGGTDVLCLVRNPQYNPGTSTVNIPWSTLYGAEYEIDSGQALNRGLRHEHNVPCAVCHVSSRSSQLMVPGTYQCPYGWTPEYTGWLMGERSGHKGRSMFTCVDKDAEVVPGQGANTNGNLFYHIQADCGTGLPCPPYDQRKELSCVVCTK